MKQRETPCSDDVLLSLLRADDGGGELGGATAHLERCGQCQARLEELAGERNHWRLVRESLTPGDEGGNGEPLDRTWDGGGWLRGPTEWTEAMARQLLSPPSHPEMLGRIGRYEVERVIGWGGMGVVYKAFDTELNRPVAVKVLAPYLSGSGAARKRFAREARAAAAIVHEHVVAIHNVETSGAAPFLVMHYVAGESLQQRLDREGPLEPCEILRIGMQVAAGLAAAHAQGLVHRDVKPSNILLEHGVERTLLTDFGLARANDDASLTHTGHHPGTPQYMSPEQARGEAVDGRSDLFSLGSVLYALCTGRPPFRAETSYGILRKITDSEPRSIREVNPNVPDWLERLVFKLLNKSADQRWQSADLVADLLMQCLAHVQQPTVVDLPPECRPGARTKIVGRLKRRSLIVSAVVAAGIFVCWLGVLFLPAGSGGDSGASPPGALPEATAADDSHSAWDETTKEFHEFDQELSAAESRAARLWDDGPRAESQQPAGEN